jgi:hypothetical protein
LLLALYGAAAPADRAELFSRLSVARIRGLALPSFPGAPDRLKEQGLSPADSAPADELHSTLATTLDAIFLPDNPSTLQSLLGHQCFA